MKIYFAGSIRGGRDDKDLYMKIIKLLKKYGEALTEHVGDKMISAMGENGPNDKQIYDRDISWLKESGVVVAEVTQPSLGVGYEIAKAEEWGKKILCLYRPDTGRRLSAMIAGSDKVEVVEYQRVEELSEVFKKFFSS